MLKQLDNGWWNVLINVGSNTINLGNFQTRDQALEAYAYANSRYFNSTLPAPV